MTALGVGATRVGPIRPAGWRIGIGLVGGVVVLVGLIALNILHGAVDLTPGDVLAALFAPTGSTGDLFVRELRLPRAVAGIVAGAALGVAGAVTQTATRNRLASPDLLGVTAGAYLAVTIGAVIPWLPAFLSLPVLCFIGGLLAAGLVFGIAAGSGMTPLRLILAGVAVSFVLSSLSLVIQLLNEEYSAAIYFWGQGTLLQEGWGRVLASAPVAVVGLAVAFAVGRPLDILGTDDGTARSLGQRVGLTRTGAVVLGVALTAAATALAGPIGFVGIVAPQAVRLTGVTRHRLLLPGSAILGAAFVLGADTIARVLGSSLNEVPVGIITAIVGAPVMAILALRMAGGRVDDDGRSSGGTLPPVRRRVVLTAVAVVLAILTVGLGVVIGEVPLADLAPPILWDIRLPRVVIGAAVGAIMAVSGVILQRILRNPIAEPAIIGIMPGAALAALVASVVGLVGSGFGLSMAALVGGLAAFGIVYAVSWRGGIDPVRLALVGVAIGIGCNAALSLVLIRADGWITEALAWLIGTLYGSSWADLQIVGPALALIPFVWIAGRQLDLLAVSDATPRVLGMRLERVRLALLGLAVILASASVAVAGQLAFVGLIAPHAARILIPGTTRSTLPLAMLLGVILVVGADTLGRSLIPPFQIPAGIFTALVGAPYFAFLLWRTPR